MVTIPLQEPVYKGATGSVFFAAGFRPFFLFSGLQALVMLPVWLLVFTGFLVAPDHWNPVVWHAHAMVFGFATAAVGGFLLTAAPSWTNTRTLSGRPLAALFVLWLAGRIAVALAGSLPAALVALFDLGYLPALALALAGPLIKAGMGRNIAFLPILTLLWLAQICTHVEALGGMPVGLRGVYLGIFILLLMIVIVGGRIIPSFTQNWLKMQGRPVEMVTIGWIEKGGAVGSIAAAALAQVLAPSSAAAGFLALVAALVHFVRLSCWHGLAVLANPLLGILHLGYFWLVAGLALLGLSAFAPALPASAALHALTAGCVGTMVIAVMSRAGLGHAGRPLVAAPMTVASYVLISIGAMLRVIAPVVAGAMVPLTLAGGLLWAAGWAAFVVVYAPILTRPRADGRPG